MPNLVIVESPTKAKTITKFLGPGFRVASSFGHVRDLPRKSLGVDVEKNYRPKYVVPAKARKTVNQLKEQAKKSDLIYFATDEDREGEAISWHLTELLKPRPEKIKRIVFHEITKNAIEQALKNPRSIDLNLVDAQQARRVLDRLVGYKLSPLLWKKVARGLSAGRVQSVAVRLIVEREREIENFKEEEYWTIDGVFSKDEQKFEAKLNKVDGKVLDKLEIKNEDQAKEILKQLKDAVYAVAKVEKKEVKKNPLPPFTTSTLQQTANNRLRFSAKQTMMLAQQLYERGYITYMRTDSVNLANRFLGEAQKYIKNEVGPDYTKGPKKYKIKSKGAQEAHEAIRPTNVFEKPEKLAQQLDKNQAKLYQLIWQRALASQMTSAVIDQTNVEINDNSDKYTFKATGAIIKFDGFLKIYPTSTKENVLPKLAVKDEVEAEEIIPNQHFTQPPARYTEATLVKALEEKGIGRPSTYAPTIATIQERNYVEKEGRKLKPTEIAYVVNDLLVTHFPKIVDYEFTAKLEGELDEIAEGKIKWEKSIDEFYQPFAENLAQKEQELSKKEITEEKTDEVCEKCGQPMIIKMGRFGKFLACTGFPSCKNTKQLNDNGEPKPAEELDEKCPACGQNLVKRQSRYGEFIGCSGYPKCKYIKKEPPKEYGPCPKCGQGKIVGKRSRKGYFYGCNRYPDCDFAVWDKPTGEKCPECESLLVETKKGVRCSNRECNYKK